MVDKWWMILGYWWTYPLVNVYITLENHHYSWVKSTISMAMLYSYVKLPEGRDWYRKPSPSFVDFVLGNPNVVFDINVGLALGNWYNCQKIGKAIVNGWIHYWTGLSSILADWGSLDPVRICLFFSTKLGGSKWVPIPLSSWWWRFHHAWKLKGDYERYWRYNRIQKYLFSGSDFVFMIPI